MKIQFKQDKRTILQILKSAGMKRKMRVLDKLNGVNERDSINILLKVLEDQSWVLREKAAKKISQYGSKAVPRLERLLTRGYWYTRAAACIALGEIGNMRPFPTIIDLLLHEDNPTVIKEASTAIIKIEQSHADTFFDTYKALQLSKTDHSLIMERLSSVDKNFIDRIRTHYEHE